MALICAFWGMACCSRSLAGIVAAIGLLRRSRLLSATSQQIDRRDRRALATVGAYVVVMLGFSTIYQATVRLALWRHGVESVEIDRLDVLDRVKAIGEASSAVGEGLADALNVGGI